MKIKKAESLIKQQLEKHKLKSWTFGWNKSKIKLGLCYTDEKYFEFSEPLFTVMNEKEVLNIIQHEISHALDFKKRGFSNHDKTWKSIALSIGCDGNRKIDVVKLKNRSAVLGLYKFLMICKNHGTINYSTKINNKTLSEYKNGEMIYQCKKCNGIAILHKNGTPIHFKKTKFVKEFIK